MFPHDSYAWYDLDLSREAEARDNGFDSWDAYQKWKEGADNSDYWYENLVNEERLFNPYAR